MLALPALLVFKGYMTSDDSKKSHSKKFQLAQSYRLIVDSLKLFTIKTMS